MGRYFLSNPRISKEFILTTDALNDGARALLSQGEVGVVPQGVSVKRGPNVGPIGSCHQVVMRGMGQFAATSWNAVWNISQPVGNTTPQQPTNCNAQGTTIPQFSTSSAPPGWGLGLSGSRRVLMVSWPRAVRPRYWVCWTGILGQSLQRLTMYSMYNILYKSYLQCN